MMLYPVLTGCHVLRSCERTIYRETACSKEVGEKRR